MSYRSQVYFELFGSKSHLTKLVELIPNLAEQNTCNGEYLQQISDNIVNVENIELAQMSDDVYGYLFGNDFIKWTDYEDEFWAMWSKAEELGIEGRFVYLGEDKSDNESDEIGLSKYGSLSWHRRILAGWLNNNDE